MFRETIDIAVGTGGPERMKHPEYVFCTGQKFLSRWGEKSVRDRLEAAERALMEIESGHLSGEDAALVAKRTLSEMERLSEMPDAVLRPLGS